VVGTSSGWCPLACFGICSGSCLQYCNEWIFMSGDILMLIPEIWSGDVLAVGSCPHPPARPVGSLTVMCGLVHAAC
jgi:hypothetical protein